MRTLAAISMIVAPVYAACRDCTPGLLGGPEDNPFTTFDATGMPGVYVNVATLGLFVRTNDLTFGDPKAGLGLERMYNSDSTQAGLFGNRWSSILDERLSQDPDKTWVWKRASGRLDRFGLSLDGKSYFAVTMAPDTLAANNDGTFTIMSPGGTLRMFNAAGQLTAVQLNGAPRVTLDYNATGQVVALRGRAASIQFTFSGNRIAAAADSAGRTVLYAYDDQGNLLQVTGADGQATYYQYDTTGAMISAGAARISYSPDAPAVASITLPDGSTRQYATPRGPREILVTDGAGDTTTYSINSAGQTEAITNALGYRTSFQYDAAGRRTRLITPNNDTLRFDYDAAGRPIAITDSGGNRWQVSYSGANLAAITDPRGGTYQLNYDAAGNPAGYTDPSGASILATRDSGGLISAVKDGKGNPTVYEYSGGLLKSRTDALSGKWSYEYDGAARVAARTDPNGTRITVQYDSTGNPTRFSAGDASVSIDPSAFQRDAAGRLTQYTDSFGNTISYRYDTAGRLAQMSIAGKVVSYTYDHAGRLASVSDWAGDTAQYRYDPAGNLTSVNTNGPVTVYQYDNARRLQSLVSTGPDGQVIAGYRYTLDANGNRTGVSALEPSAGSLTSAPVAMTYDAANRLVARDDGATLQYDAGGNLTAISGPKMAAISYDAFGRVASFASDSMTQYGYDALGLRVQRTTNGAVRRFVYDSSGPRPRPVMETDDSGNVIAWYVYGTGLLWKVAGDGTAYFYHFDGDGNVVALSNPPNGVVNRYRYDPAGQLTASDEKVENSFRAHGEAGWIDDRNGLLYNGADYYAPEIRRTLRGSIDLQPQYPSPSPPLSGAASCFVQGVANCAFAAGRKDQ